MALAGQATGSSRRLWVNALGILALVVSAISTVFTILDAIAAAAMSTSLRSLTVTASVVGMVNLFTIGLFLVLVTLRANTDGIRSVRNGLTFALSGIFLSAVSSSLTIGVLVFLKMHHFEATGSLLSSWTKQLPAQFAVWALAVIAQVLFYYFVLQRNPSLVEQDLSDSADSTTVPALRGRDSVTSETREGSPRLKLKIVSQPYSSQDSGISPSVSNASSQSLQSWRSSLQQAVRPMTSRSKLLARQGPPREQKRSHTDANSIDDESSQSDGFDSWDTSSVDPSVKDSLMVSAPSRGTILETIPGSRPASPARALDGPFPTLSEEDLTEILEPPRAISISSRSPSPAFDESHIHPLFRTDSPTPPPAASPGTVVTASPMSGQVIARPYSRTRSNSRTTSPSPLGHPQSTMDSRARSASATRAVTPPIPQSILNHSASFSEVER
jgi:hypothetical protein